MQWIKYDDCYLFGSDDDTVKMIHGWPRNYAHASTYFTHVLQHTNGRMKSKTTNYGKEDRVCLYCHDMSGIRGMPFDE
jgi:hypothetical protein